MKTFLSLGSNLGDRLTTLALATRALRERGGDIRVVRVSPVYESAPIGPDGAERHDQDAFLNCVVEIETSLAPPALHDATAAIERQLGRKNKERWQPRTIDIDIALYGDRRIDTPELVVPHARMHERAFVILPLLDLDPDIEAPGLGRLSAFVSRVTGQSCRLHTSADEFVRMSASAA